MLTRKDRRDVVVEGQRGYPPPLQKPNSLGEQLARGQRLEGTVTRITEFGAFVDIGAGRDGLVHISELQPGRVQKVSDVLKEGQQIVVWVKDVDLKKKRISLTLVDPNRKKIRDLIPGTMVQGTVTRLAPYGAFVDIGAEREGMLHVREMAEGYVEDPAKIVRPGDTVTVRILSVDPRRHRVDLSMKPEQPAPEESEELEASEEAKDEEAPTYMEMAMQRALERRERRERRERKRKERLAYREEQEEILSRTLERHNYSR